MFSPEKSFLRQPFTWALAFSLLLHGLALLIPQQQPAKPGGVHQPLQARLSLPPAPLPAPPAAAVEEPLPTPPAKPVPAKPPADKRLRMAEKSPRPALRSPNPQWSVAQKDEMKNFMAELENQPRPAPDLARQALAMAREGSRDGGQQVSDRFQTLEMRPDAPPVDPLSLEMYVDSLLKKLNRSAAFVRHDARAKGLRMAAVQIRLNPDGSLKEFEILNAGDQQVEIAFVKSVVQQAVPFSPFPNDIRRSAQSLAMVICIQPTGWGGGGFGFTRHGGTGC